MMPNIRLNTRFFWWLAAAALALRMAFMAMMPLNDPSESRYAVLAANMARTGDFLVPRFYHRGVYQSFDGKPPLFFQAGGVACKVFGQNEFAVRLPSLLAALLSVGMVYLTLRRLRNKKAAACAAVMCGTNCLFYLFAGLCMTDMLLAFCVTGALCAYMLFAGETAAMEEVKKTKGIFTRQKGFSVLFFAFLGLGMMAKGPVAVVLAGLPIFIYVGLAKRWKELTRHAWVAGPLVFFAIALPWYALMAKRDPDFLEYFFLNENFLRFLKPEYGDKYGSGHDTFKGMALVWFAVASLPWLPLAIGTGVWRRGRQWMSRKDFSSRPELALPLLGCLCMTAFWCLTSRALLPYLLPAAPLVAVWAAAKLDEWGVLEARGWGRTLGALAPFACFVVWVGICIATWLGQNVNGKMPRRIYRELSRIQAETPAYADAKFEFMHNDPYSAEFYLGDATRRDLPADVQGNPGLIREKQERAREAMAREGDDAAKARIHAKLATDALARSRGDFFFVTRKQMAFFDEPPQREVAYSNRAWTVYAPVARGAE